MPNSKLLMTHKSSEEKQSIDELWKSVENLASGRVKDNALSDEYPLSVRETQLSSLKTLVEEIEKNHDSMKS